MSEQFVLSADHPVLRHHSVQGRRVFPGLAYIDLFHQVLRERGIDFASVQLRNASIYRPLIVAEGEDIELRFDWHELGERGQRLEAWGRAADSASDAGWIRYASTEIRVSAAPRFDERIDIAHVRRTARRISSMNEIYDACRRQDLIHTGFMRADGECRAGTDAIYVECSALRDEGGADGVMFHPALLDGAAVAVATAQGREQPQGAQVLSLPLCFESFRASRLLTSSCVVRTRLESIRRSGDVGYLSFDFFDEAGVKIAELVALAGRPIPASGLVSAVAPAGVVAPASVVAAVSVVSPVGVVAPAVEAGGPAEKRDVLRLVTDLIAHRRGVPAARINPQTPFPELGLDSASLLELVQSLEARLGTSLSPTLLFEYTTSAALAEHLASLPGWAPPGRNEVAHADERRGVSPVSALLAESRAPLTESGARLDVAGGACNDIAIIGLAGRFPGAPNVEAFWSNLLAGTDSVVEIPADRWDSNEGTTADPPSRCRWGGFIDGVADFDPLFFSISPRQAVAMDPQERLFLENVWDLLEENGCTRDELRNRYGAKVGVYVGSMYRHHGAVDTDAVTESLASIASQSALANRVSSFFGLEGPSVAVDTMCSSAATAIHLARRDLLSGECELAIAGAVNLSVHPQKYRGLSQIQLAATHPGSRAFTQGDGFLPAECVGSVLLKRLQDAERDGDRILGVIKASAVSHGGRGSGFAAPNLDAQARLIEATLRAAHVEASTIGCVEAAANGAAVGDAIEVSALKRAFGMRPAEQGACSLGSVKSSIGHPEGASAIAQLAKVVLQMQHGQFVPTLLSGPLNRAIVLEGSAFSLQTEAQIWPRRVQVVDGAPVALARRALIDSFGAGGSYACLLVEEYVAGPSLEDNTCEASNTEQVILLSARTPEALRQSAERLRSYVSAPADVKFADIAYTLQVGRESMEYRLALVVRTANELIEGLDEFLTPQDGRVRKYAGEVTENSPLANVLTPAIGGALVEAAVAERDPGKLGQLWTLGAVVPWAVLHKGQKRCKLQLPTYPFQKQRCWPARREETTVAASRPAQSIAEVAVHEAQQGRSLSNDPADFVTRWLSDALAIAADQIRPNRFLQAYGLDSLIGMRLAAAVDAQFGVKLPASALLVESTVDSVAKYIAERFDGSKPSVAAPRAASSSALSEAQSGIWSYCKAYPSSAAYNIPVSIRFHHTLDVAVFQKALDSLLAQHPVLTSIVEEQQGVPCLKLRTERKFQVERYDATNLSADALNAEISRYAQEPLSLKTGPLFRLHLFTVSPEESVLLAVAHHIIFDGASVEPLLASLLRGYEDALAGRSPSCDRVAAHYAEFVGWERAYLESAQADADRAFWTRHLEGFAERAVAAAAPSTKPSFASVTRLLGSETSRAIRTLAREQGVNISTAFLCAYEAVLREHRGSSDLVVGVPVVVRPEERFRGMIGLCVNLLPLRSTLAVATDSRDLLRDTQGRMAGALEHAFYPFRRMVRDLRARGAASSVPVIRDVFVHRNASTLNLSAWQARKGTALRAELFDAVHQESEYPLLLEVMETGDDFVLRFVARSSELDAAGVDSMMERYSVILARIAGVSNDAPAAHTPSAALLHGGFEAQVAKTPDAQALLFRDQALSYASLEREANALAVQLADYGVGRGSIVGVLADRSLEMVIALLGILKAGAAYLPLDPRLPEDRLQFMLSDAAVAAVITHPVWEKKARSITTARVHVCGEGSAGAVVRPGARVTTPPQPDDVAYVIYTSGSTGRPKGCVVTHRAVYNRLRWMEKVISLSASDRILQKTPFSFDVSVPEFFWPLSHGATLVMAEPEGHKDSSYLIDTIRKHEITICHFVPSMLRLFLRNESAGRCTSLRHVLASGEALSFELITAFNRTLGAGLQNLYGPTEAAVEVTHWECEERPDRKAPIGRAIDNVRMLILDGGLKEVAAGETGELYIAGICLANGYLNRPRLTAERFIASPFGSGERLYRTGDLARWCEDGCIEYLGRIDSQVKINGFRVELGEIEQRLEEHADVAAAAALVVEQGEHKQIAVYYAVKAAADRSMSADQRKRAIREFMRKALPAYMVPSHFHEISVMPLTSSGKIDRKALPAAAALATAPEPEAPRVVTNARDVEKRILAIWQDVLHAPSGVDDAFFDVGGDSVLAVTVCERITAQFGVEFTPTMFFNTATVRAMSRHVADAMSSKSATVVEPRPQAAPPARDAISTFEQAAILPRYYDDSVAIIGISCELPGAADHRKFWQNLRHGLESVEVLDASQLAQLGVPESLASAPEYVPVRCTIPGKTRFDAEFFGLSRRDARNLDPQLRVLLSHSWKAIEDAGYAHTDIPDTGVFMSASTSPRAPPSGSDTDHLEPYVDWVQSQPGTFPTQISHRLKLTGPSLFVHSNCSSSLVGVGLAFRSLLAGETSYALVGATTLFAGSNAGYLHAQGMNLSRTGHVRAFDAAADGMLAGEGVAVVLLKRAADAVRDGDHVYALIRGVATRNDGGDKAGFYAPAVRGQAEAIDRALRAADVDPETIGYVEAHGTGTRLGDPVEIAALTDAYRRYTSRTGFCGIGSVKSSIGHLDTAAGLAGCIKVALSLSHGELAPTANFERPNPALNLDTSPFYIVDSLRSWEAGVTPLRAAVSSMGLGGTNSHAVLEQYPTKARAGESAEAAPTVPQIVPLSARNEGRLREYARSLASFLAEARDHSDHSDHSDRVSLRDIAYTLQIGRVAMVERAVFVASNVEELRTQLEAFAASGTLFPGGHKSQVRDGVRDLLDDEEASILVDGFIANGKLDRIARYWVNGGQLDWTKLHRIGPAPRRMSLPTYPFAPEEFASAPPARTAAAVVVAAQPPAALPPAPTGTDDRQQRALAYVRDTLSRALELPANSLERDTRFEALGLDSVNIARLTQVMHSVFPDITTNAFFEHQTIGELAAHLAASAPARELVPVRAAAASGDIAIIGLAGRYPKAANVNELWERLRAGENCVDVIPADRWDNEAYYNEKRGTWGNIYTKWGGLLDHIDKFDADFFRISPREAETIDPQERLFLQEAYATVEDAGYTPEELGRSRKVGVFVGVTNRMYPKLAGYVNPCGFWSVANRVSFLLNFTGPSLAVDTACSASLTAIHLAVESLRSGTSDCAIAGGVNLIVDPVQYMASCAIGALSSGDRCRPFGDDADGFVEGEAVGAILLKPLAAALADGDHIYGVIKGTAVSHGGRTNGYTVPNPAAQARLIGDALGVANVDPREISYVEAHGTGTSLGDPIEVAGLSKAFRAHTSDTQFCALGSIKSNIGHAESAAGIAGVTKVLLQLRHGQIAPTLHARVPNPQIDFGTTPFSLQHELGEWKPNGPARVAAVSSFGIGGANAHVILGEHRIEADARSEISPQPVAVVLSGRNERALKDRAKALLHFIRTQSLKDADLVALACTLQVGREAMECRLGFVASSVREVERRLQEFLEASTAGQPQLSGGLWRGDVKRSVTPAAIGVQDRDPVALLDAWIRGAQIDWSALYGAQRPRRMSLPTYPFALDRHWVTPEPVATAVKPAAVNAGVPAPAAPPAIEATRTSPTATSEEPFELMQFEESWIPAEGTEARAASALQSVACFVSSLEHRNTIERQVQQLHAGARVIFVCEGREYLQRSLTQFEICPNDATHYERALKQISADHGVVAAILYLWPLERTEWLSEPAPIMYLLQGLMRSQLKCGRLLLAGECHPGVERCHLDSWLGFERSMGLILPQTPVAVVAEELPGATPAAVDSGAAERMSRWTRRLCDELTRVKVQSAFYSGGVRHISRIRPQEAGTGAARPILRRGGSYLITGGCGGLGLLVARHLSRHYAANLVLTGRAALDERRQSALEELRGLGASGAIYVQADVCDLPSMKLAVAEARARFGSLQGVLHAAGLESGEGIATKTLDQFERVRAPKVRGTLVLDEALRGEALDFICYFSSSSGILGDFGACDYAVANRFEAAYARYRSTRSDAAGLSGKAVAISWPMWKDGGMGVVDEQDARTHLYFKSSGQRLLRSDEGVQTWERLLGEPGAHTLVIVGRPSRVRRFLNLGDSATAPAGSEAPAQAEVVAVIRGRPAQLRGLDLAQCVAWDLKEHAARLLKLPRERIDMDENLADFGFDSIGLAEFARKLSDHYSIQLAPAVFFAHPTLGQVTKHFSTDLREHMEGFYREEEVTQVQTDRVVPDVPVTAAVVEAPKAFSSVIEPIAVLGMSGRFPQARSVDELWSILAESRDVVQEIPEERFDWRDYYGGPVRQPGKSNTKWCGSVPGAMEFEPAFFEISPREAAQIDPRQRLLLQESWRALEDAGLGPVQLGGQRVGMFVGVEQGDYQILANGEASVTANHEGILAARLAYFLNLNGPVMAINTACSSGLVAAHQACLSLRSGECEVAVAAGVNLLLTPYGYVGMSQAGMFSDDGKCRAFGQNANGMVPGEAIAVVVLKRLSQALRDGDPIHAVIRGSGINYDGKTNGITAPNGAAQAQLLKDVYARCGVQARDIEYVVTHGTGTALGDPVEVSALNEAFATQTQDREFCALTSTKSNLGHTFAASGLVSLIALIQSMRHETIPATLHCERESDHIQWSRSPFYINKSPRAWTPGASAKLTGAVSAFGMSGTNAHMVVESCHSLPREVLPADAGPFLLVVSGKTEAALQERVLELRSALEARDVDAASLRAMSHTLLCGRHHFAHRCAVVVHDREQALHVLEQFSQKEAVPNLFRGRVARDFSGQVALARYGEGLLGEIAASRAGRQDNLRAVADLFCQGYVLDWVTLFGQSRPRRMHLPAYPFSRQTYGSTTRKEGESRVVAAVEAPRAVAQPTAVSVPTPTAARPEPAAGISTTSKIVLRSIADLDAEPRTPASEPLPKPTGIRLAPVASEVVTPIPAVAAKPAISATPAASKPAPAAASKPAPAAPAKASAPLPAAPARAAAVAVLKEDLIELLANALYLPAEEIDETRPFNELGLDSITAVEWIRAVNTKYGLSIPITSVYAHPDVRSFRAFLVEATAVEVAPIPAPPAPPPATAAPTSVSTPAPMSAPPPAPTSEKRPSSLDRLLHKLYEGSVSAERVKELLNQLAERRTAK